MIGRKFEQERLLEKYRSDLSEFIVVYGRRRVGKTFLVRETFNGKFAFQHTGHSKGNMAEQLLYFRDSLEDSGWKCPILKTWHDAFRQLQKHLEALPEGRKVVFLDELPYMATHKSGCVAALEHFWNGWASARKDIVLVVCGSAASWLLKKIIGDKGGLHNRVTCKLHLSPFTLDECEKFAASKHLGYSRRQIAECYMALGGIPYYWNYLQKGVSVQRNMDLLFFAEDAGLKTEYDELYRSLFDFPEPYMAIVSVLGEFGAGLTRDEISIKADIPSSGRLSGYLDDLEKCGFIGRFKSFGRESNGAVYRLMDNYTLFYFQFVRNNSDGDTRFWSNSIDAGFRRVWIGHAFERLCLRHVDQIKAALGIAGVKTSVSTWRHKADDLCPQGAEIDLVIDRRDDLINLCEMKFHSGSFVITKKYADELSVKRQVFVAVTGTKKGIHQTFVTADGLFDNEYAADVQSSVVLDDLFAPGLR